MEPTASDQGVLDLSFESEPSPPPPDIPGLQYIRAFLNDQEQENAIEHIDKSPWLKDLERQVQHYGWRYDYRARTINRDMRIGPLPDWLAEIAVLLHRRTGKFDRVPNQAIVNEYLPGQGIAMHVDRHCFGPAVATVSLGDDWTMDFRGVGGNEKAQLLLERGSALVLTGEARDCWFHGIAKRKSESVGSIRRRPRKRRLSLTFRTVQLADGV